MNTQTHSRAERKRLKRYRRKLRRESLSDLAFKQRVLDYFQRFGQKLIAKRWNDMLGGRPLLTVMPMNGPPPGWVPPPP